ncbi:uncharacterized protein METZ01_LOCUS298689, partial [marine metagenome]
MTEFFLKIFFIVLGSINARQTTTRPLHLKRLGMSSLRSVQNSWTQQNNQLAPFIRIITVFKQPAQERDIPKDRHPTL